MEALLSQLKDLVELRDKARVALPGVLCGFLAMILFLPPKPIDWIPVVTSVVPATPTVPPGDLKVVDQNKKVDPVAPSDVLVPPILPPNDLKVVYQNKKVDPKMSYGPYGTLFGRAFTPVRKEPACMIDVFELNPANQPTGLLFKAHNASAQNRQQALEEQNENLDRCLAAEKRLMGREESAIAALDVDLKTLEASQGQQAALIAGYENAHSPLLNAAWGRGKLFETAIQTRKKEITKDEQLIRDRQWETGELTRWKSVVSDRLADPGKLRPQLGFDDYLSALSKHFLAFIVLSAIVGMLVECLSTPGMLKAMEWFTFETE